MSYCSENKIPADVSLGRVIEVIELLGYIKVRNPLKTKAQVAFMFGMETKEYFICRN